ncbi:MAG: hypothetical protein ACREM3_30030 [Candidatus Rokuibacteriota bacterium]
MARNNFSLTTSAELALSAGVAKTILQLVPSASVLVALQQICLSFDGISSTAEPIKCDILRQTTGGTMSSRTPFKTKDHATGLVTQGQENATVEPAAGNLLMTWHIHPQAGVIYSLPLPDGEIEIPGGERLGLRLTAPANVNCLATLMAEE